TRLSLAPRMVPLDTSFSEDSAFPAGTKQDQKQLALSGSGEKDGGEKADDGSLITLFSGELKLDPHARVGVYEQEVSPRYFGLTLHDAIERMYLDKYISISETKIRQLMANYLYVDSDGSVLIDNLSCRIKERFHVIRMLMHIHQ